MTLSETIDLILVPKGAEYQAVVRGLRKSGLQPLPPTIAIPVGPLPVMERLVSLPLTLPTGGRFLNVLIMGVCGGLSPSVAVGQRVVPDVCLSRFLGESSLDSIPATQLFSPDLCQALKASLLPSEALVDSQTLMVSSDRAVCLATEKQQLQQSTGAAIIDMEGAAVLAALSQWPVSVAMVRVVSDDCTRDLPDLNSALNPDGSLAPLQLSVQMLRHPLRSRHLIVGALRALGELRAVAEELGRFMQRTNG
ncbi:MAG: phosphorylase [Cyanobacteria bacterium P01_E01_bin.34]